MKPSQIFHQYIWIINKLRAYRKLTLDELNHDPIGLVPVSLSLEIPKKNKFSLGYLLAYSYLCSRLRKKS